MPDLISALRQLGKLRPERQTHVLVWLEQRSRLRGIDRGGVFMWLLALAREERMGVTIEQNEPETDGTTTTEVVVWRWHREPSGGLTPHKVELAHADHDDTTTALALAITAALSRPEGA
ncbi:MAG: hypothetical protein Rubg2KO_15350 [Rubricoccaceae bacterium]